MHMHLHKNTIWNVSFNTERIPQYAHPATIVHKENTDQCKAASPIKILPENHQKELSAAQILLGENKNMFP